MTFYLFIFLVSLIFSIFAYTKQLSLINNKIVSFLFGFFLIMLAGFRYNISTDYWSYNELFVTRLNNERLEVGFRFLMDFVRNLNGSYNVFVFIVALISISVKMLYFSELENPFLGFFIFICLYFFDADFNIIRQGLGIGFIWWAVEYGKKKKIVQYLFLVVIASSFHMVYLIYIPLYFVCCRSIKLNRKKMVFILIFVFLMRLVVIPPMLALLLSLAKGIGGVYIAQISLYLGVQDFHMNFSIIRRLIYIILYLLITRDDELDSYFIFYVFSFFISILLTGNEMFSHRLSLCFDIFVIPLFANIKIDLNYRNLKYILSFYAVTSALFFLNVKPVLPYQYY